MFFLLPPAPLGAMGLRLTIQCREAICEPSPAHTGKFGCVYCCCDKHGLKYQLRRRLAWVPLWSALDLRAGGTRWLWGGNRMAVLNMAARRLRKWKPSLLAFSLFSHMAVMVSLAH